MLKCREVAEQASDYIEGKQTWRQRLSWRMHLMMCGHCRLFMKQLKLTCDMVMGRKVPQASEKEVQQVMQCIADDHKPSVDEQK